MPGELVRCSVADGVALVTLDNPPLNLVTLELTHALNALVARLAADESVRVMVLTGSGTKAFCAGSDIKEFPRMMAPGVVVPVLSVDRTPSLPPPPGAATVTFAPKLL